MPSTRYPWPAPIDYSKQAYEVPGTRKEGQTGHYRNSAHPDLLTLSSPNVPYTTIPELLAYVLRTFPPSSPFLGHLSPAQNPTHYEWESFADGDRRRRDVGSGVQLLYESGEVRANDMGLEVVGIWSFNRPEWQIIDFALTSWTRVGVSLYDTLGPDSVGAINHAQLPLVFTTASHIPALLQLAPKCPSLRVIVAIDALAPGALDIVKGWAKEKGVRVMTLEEVERSGRENPREMRLPKPDDVATISYTSGTTSNPKGMFHPRPPLPSVVLTHRNIVIAAHSHAIGAIVDDQGTMFSYLPLAHIYGRVHELLAMSYGIAIGYSSGDVLKLLDECRLLKPHFFISVPRVLNRIYSAIKAQMDVGGVQGALVKRAMDTKIRNLHETGSVTHPLWDALVFRKARALLGGRLQMVTSGAAPISGEVLDFFKVVFSCEVLQGYGMTENGGSTTHCLSGDPFSAGPIGPPSPGNEVKLVDVPEMGYRSTDKPNPRGELCMRGENCFRRYYKDEKNTKEAVDDEGWVHTGDVAEIDELGRFKIIDRIKNIMKLSQGEYVALEKVESAYATCPLIAQVFIHGDGLRDHVLAVVVPDPAHLAPLASRAMGKPVSASDGKAIAEAVGDERVVKAVLDVMTGEAKKHGLKGFETAKKVHLTLEPFSIENGILTATLKLKRRDAYLRYKDVLDRMYDLEGSTPSKDLEKAKL